MLAYCKEHPVMGVQCFQNQVRFFSDIPNLEYCQRYDGNIQAANYTASAQSQNGWKRPASWAELDAPACYLGTIRFWDRGYENLPDLAIFAEALCKKLTRLSAAEHIQAVSYVTEHYSGTTKVITTNKTIIYHDFFLYDKKNYLQLKTQQQKQKEKEQQLLKNYQFESPGKKTWE